MLRFERTFNYGLVRGIITHPHIWPWVTDDLSVPPEQYRPAEGDSIWYVLAWDDNRLLGMWAFFPQTGIAWEVHTCLLPRHGFRRARQAGRALAEWIWQNTHCRRIFTNVPAFNRLALSFAEDCGMKPFGVNAASFLKNGTLYDQILLGISRPGE